MGDTADITVLAQSKTLLMKKHMEITCVSHVVTVTISTHLPPLRLETIMHRSAHVFILFLHEVAILDIVSIY